MTDEQRLKKIETVLEDIRPNIQMDGGDISFVKFIDGVIYIRLSGTALCRSSIDTLITKLREIFKEHMPDIHDVMTVDEYE